MRQASLRVVGLVILFAVASGDASAQTDTTAGRLRQLVCRGKQGFSPRVVSDPSPRNTRVVTMRLDYARPTKMPGVAYDNLDPGACTWNPQGFATGYPPEPGVVYFDLPPEAQPWSETRTRLMDTTAKAAEHFPDVITVPRYLNDPAHLWLFYVDDKTHYSVSWGAWVTNKAPPRLVSVTGSLTPAAATGPAELRCRGGGGLAFHRGNSAGTNLVLMTLGYSTGRRQAGDDGSGLAAGTCAWTDRAGMKAEPGQVRFITAKDASSTAKAGMSSAPAPNAAETAPDANTIPVYLKDPAHYWSFTVDKSRPDSARSHGAWRSSVISAISGPVSKASPVRSAPGAGSSPATIGGGLRSPGNATSGVSTLTKAPLRLDGIDRALDRFTIRFSGRPNATPSVHYSTDKPLRAPGTGKWFFPSVSQQATGGIGGLNTDVTRGPATALRGQYSATTRFTPHRGTLYHYIITIPASPSSPEEQYQGQFTTMKQSVTVTITSVSISKSTIDAASVRTDVIGWADSAGTFVSCDGACDTAGNRLRMMVFAMPQFSSGRPPTSWNAVAGLNTGIAKKEIDLRTISDARPSVSFMIRSTPGDIEFEAYGMITVKRQ